jgi:hypothetical protein
MAFEQLCCTDDNESCSENGEKALYPKSDTHRDAS